jgi:hypothetical protein
MSTRPKSRFALAAVAAVLLFEAVASWVSRATGWSHSLSSIGSLAIYTAVAFQAGRRFGVQLAVGVTMLTATAESTLGWAISWAIGPGRQPTVLARPGVILAIVLSALLVGGLIGFFAGLLGVWVREGGAYEEGTG